MKIDIAKPTPARSATRPTPRQDISVCNRRSPSLTRIQLVKNTPTGLPTTSASATPNMIQGVSSFAKTVTGQRYAGIRECEERHDPVRDPRMTPEAIAAFGPRALVGQFLPLARAMQRPLERLEGAESADARHANIAKRVPSGYPRVSQIDGIGQLWLPHRSSIARIASRYPFAPAPQITAVAATEIVEWRYSSERACMLVICNSTTGR